MGRFPLLETRLPTRDKCVGRLLVWSVNFYLKLFILRPPTCDFQNILSGVPITYLINNTLSQFKSCPSLLFITETKLLDSKLSDQLSKIRIDGFDLVFTNSSTQAGGSAIYVSNTLKFVERNDIIFEHTDCEACFVEILCKDSNQNHIFGSLYRHPRPDTRSFNLYLGEFLERFTERNTKLTVLGDKYWPE